MSEVSYTLIAAMDKNRVIGFDNDMPWHLPADLAHFKRMTMGHSILMGRKTFDSIGRALPGRQNIVLTSQKNWQAKGVKTIHDLSELDTLNEEIMVIGGASLYELLLPKSQRMLITHIDTTLPDGDTWFPAWNPEEWALVAQQVHPADEFNIYWLKFTEYQRR